MTLNWKKIASGVLVTALTAAITAAVHAVIPSLTAYVPASVLAGVAHYVDAWGSNPIVPASEDKPAD